MSKRKNAEKEVPVQQADWVLRACLIIITLILGYGSLFAGWFAMPDKIDTIDQGVKELLELRAHRIFTVVPEQRTEYSSMNPRVFEVEIPPYAVEMPAAFEFDQRPVVPLPASLGQGYDYLGWSVAFGPETLDLLEPFTARVALTPEERALTGVTLVYWSADEMRWDEIPSLIKQDPVTGELFLSFESKDTGLFALASKP